MIRKIGRVIEDHIEKIVLIIVGILSIWLLMTRVIFSPNVVPYNFEGKTINVKPSKIDSLIETEARNELLQKKISDFPKIEPYKPRTNEFLALLEQPVSNINISLNIPNPKSFQPTTARDTDMYNLPDDIVGHVRNVDMDYIRAAAYIPTSTITLENSYSDNTSEPNNLDLVTVEAEYDIAGLCDRLYEVFIDDVYEPEYKDPCLAKPIFATVNLQRRELTDKGSWSDWKNVSQPKTDAYGDLFNVTEDVKNLPPGGLELRKLQLDDKEVQIDLLQPAGYQIASAKEELLPPRIHSKYLDAQAKEERQERIDARAEENSDRNDNRNNRRNTRSNTIGTQGGVYGAGQNTGRTRGNRTNTRGNTNNEYSYDSATTDRTRNRRGRTDETASDIYTDQQEEEISPMDEVYDEYDKILITYDTDFAKMSEPLVFWHYDDTVEPFKTYQYRIRLGLLNQIAGKKPNDLILWSDFSEPTDTVEIPGMTYFFAKSIKEAAKTVNVAVCKYVLGYWYSESFSVAQGEAIGDVVENETEDEPETRSRITDTTTLYTVVAEESVEPESIDYSTGAVMVDVLAVNDYLEGRDTLDSRNYHDMLYSYDGINIEHMPVNSKYWPQDMVRANANISRQLKEEKEPLKEFDANKRLQQRKSRRDGLYGEYGYIDNRR